jgi:hypothetical protein
MARPKKEINWDIVEKKMQAGCPAKEIAAGVCDLDTFYHRFKERYSKSFGDYSDEYYSEGDGNLRFLQYMKAMGGNIKMLEILCKERLGQGKEQARYSNVELLEISHQNMILRDEVRKLKEILNAEPPQNNN